MIGGMVDNMKQNSGNSAGICPAESTAVVCQFVEV
jgi:hypothetical protein